MTLPMYATVPDMLRAATGGWDDLAQRASTSPLVDGALLQATVDGADRSVWTAQACAYADAALARLQDVLNRASRHADTYLFPRYRQTMPLADAVVQASSLPDAVAAIAYKRLYGALLPEDVRKGTAWADDYLKDLSAGRVSLGAQDEVVAQAPGRVISRSPARVFDLADY
jgi:phage gp36-like protein